jgi:methyltransferase (TIGR00027 family)
MESHQPSQTAAQVALARAIEYMLPGHRRICHDPYAYHFINDDRKRVCQHWLWRKLYRIRTEMLVPGVVGAVVVRARYIDDYLEACVASGIEQLVILGAGYDTRALRCGRLLESVRVFEVDHPATQQRKLSVLNQIAQAPAAETAYVAVRFNCEDLGQKLLGAGYRPDAKTLFIWEGVTYYITAKAVDDTLAFIVQNAGAGSSIVFDFFPPSVADGTCTLKEARAMRAWFAQLGEHLTFGVDPEAAEAFLTTRGFRQIYLVTARELKQRYFKGLNRFRNVSDIFALVIAGV